MSVDRKSIPIDELTTEQPESTDTAYLAWKKAKIEAALKHADEHPNEFLTEQETWKELGIDDKRPINRSTSVGIAGRRFPTDVDRENHATDYASLQSALCGLYST